MLDESILEPELVALAREVPDFDLSPEGLALLRAQGPLAPPAPLSDDVVRTDHVVQDDPRLVVRVHRPRAVSGVLPCVYSIHGGGYILGDYTMDDARFDR